jgi:predicted O-linked N-acetylglucosamine transferase (SPINDLY family)
VNPGDLARAQSLLQAGRADEAVALCREILRVRPQDVSALELAGTAHARSGDLAGARSYFERAVSVGAGNATTLARLAQIYCALREFDRAEASARRALALEARHAEAHNVLGNVFAGREAWDEAILHYRRAIAADPQCAIFHHNLGYALQNVGDETAEGAYRKAIAIAPEFAPAYVNLGGLLLKQDSYEEARQLLQRAVVLDPGDVDAYNNLGLANRRLGKLSEAFNAYRAGLEKNPKAAGIWHNLGLLYEEANRFDEAMPCFKRALELNPEFLEAQRDWLRMLYARGDLDVAHAAVTSLWERLEYVVSPAPVLPVVIDVLGRSTDFTERDRAVELFRHSLQGGRYPPRSLTSLVLSLHYLENISEDDLLRYHRLWGEAVEREAAGERFISWPVTDVAEPLRIGYLSPDFRAHSVGHFILPVLAHHDPRQVEVHCYANQRTNDDVTQRVRASVAHYTEVRDLTDRQLAQRIHDDGIHILVDLAGHTAETRLNVLALRPAPLQITWLGYPNTTGLTTVDYRLSDPHADRYEADVGTERLLRLPESFLCFGSFRERPRRTSPPCLDQGFVTFASFNNLSKLNAGMVQTWSRILVAVPGSRLLIKSKGGASACVRKHLEEAFSRHGISADRLVLAGHMPQTEAHLDLYNDVDIALDTFPYHGATTTCEALWMGVPVVTQVDEAHRSRVGLSLLTNAGISETIATDEEQYVRIAVQLASDPKRLAQLRTEIPTRLRHSILCDPARFTRQLEEALIQAWRVHERAR